MNPLFANLLRHRAAWWAFALAWLLGCVVGMGWLMRYKSIPGAESATPAEWPQTSKINRAGDRATLVLFVHPHCPCSRATLDELSRIVAQADGKLDVHVLFAQPQGADASWQKTDLWRTASAMDGVRVDTDIDGSEARRFGAATSGHTILFDRQGKQLFSGGITMARGHSGDNPGHAAVVALARQLPAECRHTSVYGCPLPIETKSPESR